MASLIGQIFLSGVVLGGVYSLFGVGLVILFRGTTILNFAQGEFFMLGAYCGYVFHSLLHFNYAISLVLAVGILMVIGGTTFRLLFARLLDAPHINQVMVTVALGFVFQGLIRMGFASEILFIPPLFGHKSTVFMGIIITSQEISILVATAVFTIFFALFFLMTRAGKLMQAASQSLRGAELIGMNVMNFHTVMWAVSAGIAALTGILIGPLISVMPEMGGDVLIKAFAAMALGGFGSIPGVLIGGVLMGIIENSTAFLISTSLREISAFCIIILVLLIRPAGIMGVKLK